MKIRITSCILVILFLISSISVTGLQINNDNNLNLKINSTENRYIMYTETNFFSKGHIKILNEHEEIEWIYKQNADHNLIVDVEQLDNGNILYVDSNYDRVREIDILGNTVWEYTENLQFPEDAERLDNGNTLITTYKKVIEIDGSDNVVWKYSTGLNKPVDVERLDNGNTIIADAVKNIIIEVDQSENIVWKMNRSDGLLCPFDVDILDNGNLLIADQSGYDAISGGDIRNGYICEIDKDKNIVWEHAPTNYNWRPDSIKRLENGNTLYADGYFGYICEINNNEEFVWYKTGISNPFNIEVFYDTPPYKPIITGPRTGDKDIEYEYDFLMESFDGNNIFCLEIDFGNEEITSISPPVSGWESGSTISVNYSWNIENKYQLKARIMNNNGIWSEWNHLDISIGDNIGPNKPVCNYDKDNNRITVSAIDPDGDQVRFGVSWDNNGNVDEWTGYYNSGDEAEIDCGEHKGTAGIIAEDEHGAQSDWFSAKSKTKQLANRILLRLIDMFPDTFPLLRLSLKL